MQKTPRFFISKFQIKRKRFLLEDERVVKHMGLVMRLKKGDKIILFDGEGKEYNAVLGYISKKQAAGVVESEGIVESKTKFHITLAQSLPRAGKLDDVVRMNTEVGVEKFILFESEYSIAKAESVNDPKLQRLQKVIVESLRQSEGTVMPSIEGAISYSELLKMPDFDSKIILHSRDTKDSKSLIEIKKKIKDGSKVLIIIGPEGGFAPKEISLAKENGCVVAYLSLPVLRTETAGVVVSAFLLIS